MRRLLALSAAILLAACATTYGQSHLGRPGGYKDKQLAPNSWHVSAVATRQAGPTFATDMALFRAAVLAKAAGYSIIHTVDFDIVDSGVYGVVTNQNAQLTFVATNDPNEPLHCRAKKRFVANCRILSVDALLREKGREMDLPPEQIDQEVARAKAGTQAP